MSISSLAVPGIRGLTPYQPGKPIGELEREFGLERIVKLASNENPLGASPKALEMVRQILGGTHLYPDGSGFELKAALAEKLAVEPAQIVLGNGSNDVLDLVARVFLAPGLNAVYSEHAFAVYPIATQTVGAAGKAAPAHDGSRGPRFGHDLEAMLERVDAHTRVVFVANPNNPTGTLLGRSELHAFLAALPERVIAVVDEAYFEYAHAPDHPNALEWLGEFPKLIVTRTFSKAYGLAGLRVGYAVSGAEIADLLNRARQPFNVNALALAAAAAALGDVEFLEATVRVNDAGLARLEAGFRTRNFDYIPSAGNFVSFDLARPGAPVYEALLREGVIVRPVGNYGLPNHLRVSVGTAEEIDVFFAALDRVLGR
ncbi:histidinol-phosphate transaminase [Methylococcus geothermalis]|uniref:Histidinol-phosphate aminotransferase n=1 Tax=Methylococcus geothermalis TaxID=2681310 RepID=A0A858Q9L1_9GAMM|nr:histidinol-phosphate transaminase [Methylococcus geothermalis]QJD30376.1 histidinol-phosphate transaminase [Methylococcus geothermalis]